MFWDSERRVQRAPLALLAISGLLDKEGYEVHIVSQALHEHPKDSILELCDGAICLGITSLTGYQITDGLETAKLVKESYPDLPIVWGGWHPTLEPEGTLESLYVDIVVKGQGERTFTELVHALESKTPLDNILGISFKNNNQIQHNPERPLEDLNNFPPIPFHLIDVEKILSTDECGDRVINYVSSYGCPNRCAFCAEWKAHRGKWTGLSAERMIDDFERLVGDYSVDSIAINDTQFFLSKKRVREFCEGLIEKNLPVQWHNVEGNIRQLLSWNDDMWELLVKSKGARDILVGSESGFPEALKFVNKELTVEETLRFADRCHQYDIKVFYSMILGLPWDQDYSKTRKLIDKEIEMTLDLSAKLIKRTGRSRMLLCIYTPYPGNPLYDQSLLLGLSPPQGLKGWSKYVLGKRNTPWITQKQADLINFVSEYIFFFLDEDSYDWVTKRVPNPLMRFMFRRVFRVFVIIAKLRWRFKFFGLRIDYRIYFWGRNKLNIA